MAEKKKFQMMNIILAIGSGAGGNIAMGALDKNIEMFQKKPILAPLTVAVGGAALTYFMSGNDKAEAAGYGLLGAAGSEIAEMKKQQQGFSRYSLTDSGYSLNGEFELSGEEEEELNGHDDNDDDDNM